MNELTRLQTFICIVVCAIILGLLLTYVGSIDSKTVWETTRANQVADGFAQRVIVVNQPTPAAPAPARTPIPDASIWFTYIKDMRTGICYVRYGDSIAVVPETSVPVHLLTLVGEVESTHK